MRKPFFLSIVFILCSTSYSGLKGSGQTRPYPPGLHEGEKQINAPIEPPVVFKQKPVDAARLKQEANELARLAAAVPPQMEQVTQGQLPKDLADKLKRIERLAKQLRSEISR